MILTKRFYRELFELEPSVKIPDKVFKLETKNVFTYMSEEELEGFYESMKSAFAKFRNVKFQLVFINRTGKIKFPQNVKSEFKKKILKEIERWMNENAYTLCENEIFGIRNKELFIVFEDSADERTVYDVLEVFKSLSVDYRYGKKEFLKSLSFLTKSPYSEAPFPFPVEIESKNGKIFAKHGGRYFLTFTQTEVLFPPKNFPKLIYRFPLECIYTVHFNFPAETQAERIISVKRSGYEKKESEFAREVVRHLNEIESLMRMKLDYVVKVNASLTVAETKEFLEENFTRIERFVEGIFGRGMKHENTVEPWIFLSQFAYNPEEYGKFEVERTMLLSSAVKLIPLFRDYPGNADERTRGSIVFLNESGEPVYVSNFANNSPHQAEIGGSGAGKSMKKNYELLFYDSVCTVELIRQDEGSYKILAYLSGGNYIPLSPDRPVSLAPFGEKITHSNVYEFLKKLDISPEELRESEIEILRSVIDEVKKDGKVDTSEVIEQLEKHNVSYLLFLLKNRKPQKVKVGEVVNRSKLAFLTSLILMLIKGESQRTFSEEEKVLVSEAIREAYGKTKEEVLLKDIYEKLKTKKEDLAVPLRRFLRDGEYGVFFDSPRTIEIKDFNAFEFRQGDTALSSPLLFAILTLMLEYFSKLENADKTKIIVMDEAWFLLNNPVLKNYVEEGLRTYRKLGIALSIITQNPEDITGTANLLTERKDLLFTTEKEKTLEVLGIEKPYDEEFKEIMPVKFYGEYSKFLVLNTSSKYALSGKRGGGTVRYIAHPLVYWISTTDDNDKILREKYKAKYGSLKEAIRKLAEEKLGREIEV